MGNCCKAASSSKVFDEGHPGKVQKEKLMETLGVSPDANGKVKIKISKKELAELLNKQEDVDGRASAEQVLLRLMRKARENDGAHRLWRPVLETISEVI
ncbi:hypothetical protein VIGAN_01549600 [Vigna angularis var. angularis]|uniref:Uncharacterized protein n=1 Tax=Vigna angularis var. angularis TaxID=157739 RepID=A0A0S3R9W5_PHAAN|nr:hypothetical protein VIGAN_01549600 [Vigna angularis var. angularis]